MKVIAKDNARKDLDDMDASLRSFFLKHMEKLSKMPPRRHMKFGLPSYVEDVTKQARLVYEVEEKTDTIWVLRCFTLHKEYEKWYKSYKT